MRRFLIAISILFVCCSSYGAESDSLLRVLDEIIPQRARYSDERRQRIATELRNLEASENDENCYGICRVLYSQYRSYRIDSALWVAERRLMAARNMHNHSKTTSASLNLAESHAHAGNYNEAIAILDTINRRAVESYHVNYLWNLYVSTYSKLARTAILSSHKLQYEQKSRSYQDSLLAKIGDGDVTYHLILCEQLLNNGLIDDALMKVEQLSQRFDFEHDASALCLMARVYCKSGDKERAKECLAQASIVDIQRGIKEYVSLTELAKVLFEEGDVDRAYAYIKCSLEDASFCNAKNRTSEIMEIMPIINTAAREKEQAYTRRVRTYMIISLILAGALLAALLIVKKQLNRNSQISRNLDRTNADLVEINERLKKSNAAKEVYINELFSRNSVYIEKLSKFRKNIYRLMATGQYEDVMQLTKSSRIESEEMKEFYAAFDEMFLSLYPNFKRDFNTMIAEKYHFDEREKSLSPELRVMALMRLGIDGSSIAEFLHYTPQTVYNYRSTIRGMLVVTKEEFDHKIRIIGRN